MAFLFIFTDLLSESRFGYKLPFYLSKGKKFKLLLIWIYLVSKCSCCADTNFIPLFSQGISINYKNDFMLTGCCQGQTEHPLSIPAAPERVLFVYRRLEIQWEIRFFAIPAPANRNFGRATIHMIEYLRYNVAFTTAGDVSQGYLSSEMRK